MLEVATFIAVDVELGHAPAPNRCESTRFQVDIVDSPETREAELVALYHWYTDWSTTARALIGRKDYLVALGLSGRNKRQRGEGTPPPRPQNMPIARPL
jgi:hypothetical protein